MTKKKSDLLESWFWPAVLFLLFLAVLLFFGIVWVVGQGAKTPAGVGPTGKKPGATAVSKRFENKSREEVVEELRQSTSAVTPEMVTEALTVGPAEGNLVKIADRRLTVKKDDKVWEFTAADDAQLTRTTLPASATGGQFPRTENIGWEALQVGARVVAVLEKDETGKQVFSRRINVILQTP